MKKALCTLLALAMIFALASCGKGPDAPEKGDGSSESPSSERESEHIHTWVDATCTEPRTCSACGATEGEALGHDMLPATTEAPATCSRCGYTEGEPLVEIVGSGACGDDLTWTLTSTGLLTISGTGPMYDYKNITEDPEGAAPWLSLSMPYTRQVVIEDGVTSIGSAAFANSPLLLGLTVPESVTSIGDGAFYLCVNLITVELPPEVTRIGRQAFYDCTSLAEILMPEGVTVIGQEAFVGCASLKSVELPESVTTIESQAFYGCDALASVTIPGGVTSIGANAFDVCGSLADITFGGTAEEWASLAAGAGIPSTAAVHFGA